MKTVSINLYEFSELSETAREKALMDQRDFELSTFEPSDYDDSFEMTYEKFEEELTDDDLIKTINANEYLYFFNGEMASICTYTGGPKIGTTEFKFNGETYIYGAEQ